MAGKEDNDGESRARRGRSRGPGDESGAVDVQQKSDIAEPDGTDPKATDEDDDDSRKRSTRGRRRPRRRFAGYPCLFERCWWRR